VNVWPPARRSRLSAFRSDPDGGNQPKSNAALEVLHKASKPTLSRPLFPHASKTPWSPAFDGLRLAGRKVRRPDLTIATEDHNVPTILGPIEDPVSKAQVETLRKNTAEFGVRLYPMGDVGQGIVHVIGPQLA